MVGSIVLLLIGFVLLIVGSNLFVDAVSSLAIRCKLPKMLIALTVASFCTCAPELSISFQSILMGNGDVVLSNIVGSCVVNILLIIGIAAMVHPIQMKSRTIKKEIPLLILITMTFVVMLCDHLFYPGMKNTISRTDGILLLLCFVMFCFYLVSIVRRRKEEDQKMVAKYGLGSSIFLILGCIVGIIIGSDLVVNSAVKIAQLVHVSDKIITMTIVVIGTSLPELTLTVISAYKGEFDMAIGNIIGTNIFNVCIVLGLPIAIFGGISSTAFGIVDAFVVLLASVLLYLFSKSGKKLTRYEGWLMVVVFILYYVYLFTSM